MRTVRADVDLYELYEYKKERYKYIEAAIAENDITKTKLWAAVQNKQHKEVEEMALIVWPTRVAGDLVIRRSRFYDLLASSGADIFDWVWQLRGLNYVRVLITGWYGLGAGSEWREMMQWFIYSPIDTFDRITGKINNILKSVDCEDGYRLFVEMRCLVGYRLLPWPGFDAEKETADLAAGGVPTDLFNGFDFWVKTFQNETHREEAYESFDSFVRSGSWITSGANSVGRLEITYRGKLYRVKCRKNMYIDYSPYGVMIADALEAKEQISIAFIKNELAKCRVAVCSDAHTYLKMVYIVKRSGKGYQLWKWVTRQEDARAKMRRMRATITACKNGFSGMAWDYEGFDRQVAMVYLVILFDAICTAARSNVPEGRFNDIDAIIENCRASFYQSYIISKDGTRFHVTGGLPSGLAITSMCGDGYNKTMITCVVWVLRQFGYSFDIVEIQGDDTNLMSKIVALLQLADWLLRRCGAIGGDGKFGITSQRTEFLRVSFDSTGAHGYPARSVAGIVQRKPWSDQATGDVDVISSIIDSVMICQRRGLQMVGVDDQLLRIWCRIHRISYLAARAPLLNGGLGLGKPVKGVVVSHMPVPDSEALTVHRLTESREAAWLLKATRYGVTMPAAVATKLADEDARAVVISDEIKGLSSAMRANWFEAMHANPPTVIRHQPISVFCSSLDISAHIVAMAEGDPVLAAQDFGRYSRLAIVLVDLQTLERYGLIDSRTWLGTHEPEFLSAMRVQQMHMTRKEAERWLLGDLPVYLDKWNPICTQDFKAACSHVVACSALPKGNLADVWIVANLYVLEAASLSSAFAELFSW